MPSREDEWLRGWDETPGIVSVWAEADGSVTVWRRVPATGALVVERERFRPWILLDTLDDVAHLGAALGSEGSGARIAYRELEGDGLRFRVSADSMPVLSAAVLSGSSRRLGRSLRHLRDLGADHVLVLSPDEQYLVATGRTYFRGLGFDQLARMQFDLETTGLDPDRDRVFLIAERLPDGKLEVREAPSMDDAGEAALIRTLEDDVRRADPDVVENHNLHGFDLPFLERRAERLGLTLTLGRTGAGLIKRAAQRGAVRGADPRRKTRFIAPGRELIDTLDAVRRYDFGTRALPGHGLKVVARHLGIAAADREYIRGDRIFAEYARDPDRVRRYATADVEEVAGLARLLGGAAFALAQMAPRRYERLADAGAATGVIDPLLVRAYLRAGAALPRHASHDGTVHQGASLSIFATGVAHRVVKVDVASLYPSLMRSYRIGPARDRLGAMLALVDRLVEERLREKDRARAAPAGTAARHNHEATSNAMKLVINSAYGYLAAGAGLTRLADVHAANEVTRRGREVLGLMCRALAERGVTLLEADTDGVYFAVPPGWTPEDERRVVAEIAGLLPPLVKLELEGRYAAMLSHEPKNYALLWYDGKLALRGVAFRSSRAEPFGEAFLRRAIERLLAGDVPGVRAAYLDVTAALHRRELTTQDVSSRARLTKSPAEYADARARRREGPYEALLASGRTAWSTGDHVRFYRTRGGGTRLAAAPEEETDEADAPRRDDPRDYDVPYYVRLLRDTFAARLARAFAPEDFDAVFADPEQAALFTGPLDAIRPILTRLAVDGAG